MDTPYSIHVLSETGSTQDDARACYVGTPVLVVAAAQTRGRGRDDAVWESAPRAMAASFGFEPSWPPERLSLLPLLAGVAAARVVDCALKWPNDLVRDDYKLGGILAEASAGLVVIGCGLNLWWPDPPQGFAALYDADPGLSRRLEIATAWVDELWRLVALGPDQWPYEEYRHLCSTLGREIVWEPDGRGTAVDVEVDGGLVVETAAGRVTLHGGEVRHIRPGVR